MTSKNELDSVTNEPLDKERMPVHVAIIMDGNGRYAKKKHQPRVWGHQVAVNRVREVVESAGRMGIKVLTLYAFSEENWGRPRAEVGAILSLIDKYVAKERDELHRNNVQFRLMGHLERLPRHTRGPLEETQRLTAKDTGLILNVALSYGSRTELVDACRSIAERVARGELDPSAIDHDMFQSALYSSDLPDPDLLIRTSGEQRISNFLLWQLAYTELYFTNVLWPDFGRTDLENAVRDFQQRHRRFGKLEKVDEAEYERKASTENASDHPAPALVAESPVC